MDSPSRESPKVTPDEVVEEIPFENRIFQNFTKSKSGKPPQYLEYFFQPMPSIDSRQLRITNVSIYSTTPWKEANFISKAIINFYRGVANKFMSQDFQYEKSSVTFPITITDATANIGGNTISFYLNGITRVNAVEKDPLTCQILKHNLRVYGLPTETTICGDYVDLYMKLDQDVVLIDAPWGGADYKKANQLDLYLSNINIVDICADLISKSRASLIVLKLPVNYNFNELIQRMPNCQFLTHKVYRSQDHHSYNIVFCW